MCPAAKGEVLSIGKPTGYYVYLECITTLSGYYVWTVFTHKGHYMED
jgi:hypothetical protein